MKPVTGLAAARQYMDFYYDPIGCVRRVYDRYGPVMVLGPAAFRQPRELFVFAIGPEFNRQVLGDPTTFRPSGLLLPGPKNSAQRRVRHGLTRMTGPEHRRQRQLVMPPFQKKAVQSYCDLMVEIVDSVIREWRPDERRDIYEDMRVLTLRIASSVLFSRDPAEALPIGGLIEEWVMITFSPLVWSAPFNLPGTPYRHMLHHAERIEEMILAMIAKRRANPSERTDVLSILMEARDEQGRGMTDVELVGQTAILFLAAFETATSSLTWTLFLLAQHPTIANQLIDELDAVLNGNPPTNEQLARLSFLQCVVKESMRILPAVGYTVRTAQKEVTIGSETVPRGTKVVCSHYVTHHLPELYPDPEKFFPERWRTIDPNQYEYLPFSAGPRMCIGGMFAMQLIKISIAMMLQRFRFTVVPGIRIDRTSRITMNPTKGLPMMVCPNDRKFTASEVRGQIREMVKLP
jgi:cytochrome P450